MMSKITHDAVVISKMSLKCFFELVRHQFSAVPGLPSLPCCGGGLGLDGEGADVHGLAFVF